MSKEMGPREKALREMREAKFDTAVKAAKILASKLMLEPTRAELAKRVTEAAKKTGKPRKAKK